MTKRMFIDENKLNMNKQIDKRTPTTFYQYLILLKNFIITQQNILKILIIQFYLPPNEIQFIV